MAIGNFMEWGSRFVAGQLKSHCTEQVKYKRGTRTLYDVPATIGQTVESQQSDQALTLSSHSVDFLISPACLKAGGVSMPPANGDKIIRCVDGNDIEYAVVAMIGQPESRESDRYNQIVRIHTRRITP